MPGSKIISISMGSKYSKDLISSLKKLLKVGYRDIRWYQYLQPLTGEVLDGDDNLTQELMVLLLGSGRIPSFNVLEHERTQRCVRHQRHTERKVRKEPPETRGAIS